MLRNTQVVYRKIDQSDSVDAYIEKKVTKLQRLVEEIILCRVVLEAPHQHHNKGKSYHVTIELVLPNLSIVVSNDHHDKGDHEDLYIALRDAFTAINKQVITKVKRKPSRERHYESLVA